MSTDPPTANTKFLDMYKFAALVASLLFVAAQGQELKTKEDIKEKLETLSKSCIHVTNAPKDSDKLINSKDVITDETHLCYLECLYRGMGLILNGEFSVDEAKDIAKIRFTDPKEYDLAILAVETCKKSVVKDPNYKCGLAYSARKCLIEFGHKHNFFPEVY